MSPMILEEERTQRLGFPLEIKVGIFVLGGLILLMVLLLNLEVFQRSTGNTLRVLFNYTYGLEIGSPVHVAGVPAGRVRSIQVQKDPEGKTRVEVVAQIRPGIEIDKEAEVRIGSKGLLGQKVLDVLPSGRVGNPAQPGDLLSGSDPVAIESIALTTERVVRKLEGSVDYLNDLIGDEAFRSTLKGNTRDAAELIGLLKEAASSLSAILERLERGEGTLGRFLTDETVYQDVEALVRDLRENPWKLLKKEKKGFLFFQS